MNIQFLMCNGPTCTQLGAAGIRKAVRLTVEKKEAEFEIIIHSCCSRCEREAGLCPSVKVNGQWITEATPDKVKKRLKDMIHGQKEPTIR